MGHAYLRWKTGGPSLPSSWRGGISPTVLAPLLGNMYDGVTLRDSAFSQALQDGTLEIPPPASLPGAEDLGSVPHVFVGDKAFPLRPNLMRPYAGRQLPLPKPVRIFNKRLSRARLVVECAFGILAARWRIAWSQPLKCRYLREGHVCSPQLPAEVIPGATPDGDGHAKWSPS
ncbi:unnamed protein product [Oncorhynchus mykiss]|uniref:DDE Tnp4 domain-containing protein n=1 Tax=Oncorhynchus mykiss TaxID=8022 RepID=A0A060Y546_ONCMY|nr:unnamed protein product [Oncorhynchus mykiss]